MHADTFVHEGLARELEPVADDVGTDTCTDRCNRLHDCELEDSVRMAR